jgi:hypothetical protein
MQRLLKDHILFFKDFSPKLNLSVLNNIKMFFKPWSIQVISEAIWSVFYLLGLCNVLDVLRQMNLFKYALSLKPLMFCSLLIEMSVLPLLRWVSIWDLWIVAWLFLLVISELLFWFVWSYICEIRKRWVKFSYESDSLSPSSLDFIVAAALCVCFRAIWSTLFGSSSANLQPAPSSVVFRRSPLPRKWSASPSPSISQVELHSALTSSYRSTLPTLKCTCL